MDHSLFLTQSWILDVGGAHNSAFTGPKSAIISDSCNHVGIQVGIWIEIFVFHAF